MLKGTHQYWLSDQDLKKRCKGFIMPYIKEMYPELYYAIKVNNNVGIFWSMRSGKSTLLKEIRGREYGIKTE